MLVATCVQEGLIRLVQSADGSLTQALGEENAVVDRKGDGSKL